MEGGHIVPPPPVLQSPKKPSTNRVNQVLERFDINL